MQKSKCILILLFLLIISLSAGCGGADEGQDDQILDFSRAETGAPPSSGGINADAADTNASGQGNSSGSSAGGQTVAPPVAGSGDFALISSVAYALPGTLYGGVEFQNAGNSAMVLKEATFTFTFDGGNEQHTFEPVAWDHDVIAPGATGYCTLWLPYEGTALPETVSLTCALSGKPAGIAGNALSVESARLIQNYPGFATLSGRLVNPAQETCELNMVYAGFYGQSGELLGVFHFTRNALLRPGDGIPFVMHLRRLPIPGLAEHTAEIRFHAFSI